MQCQFYQYYTSKSLLIPFQIGFRIAMTLLQYYLDTREPALDTMHKLIVLCGTLQVVYEKLNHATSPIQIAATNSVE